MNPARSIRRTLVCAVTLMILVHTHTANAKVPDPRNSHVDPVLVGTSSGVLVPGFLVEAHDVGSAPLYNQVVTLRLDSPSLAFLHAQNEGCTSDCASRTIEAMTDRLGQAVFGARLCGHDEDPAAVTVLVEGVVLAHVPARSTDLAGMDGATNLEDFRTFRELFLSRNAPAPALDFDADGVVNSADLQIFRQELFRGVTGVPCP